MTPAGIEPATSRFVAQHLNHCATAVPLWPKYLNIINHDQTSFRYLISVYRCVCVCVCVYSYSVMSSYSYVY